MKYLSLFAMIILFLASCGAPASEQKEEKVTENTPTEIVEPQKTPYQDIDVVQFKKRMAYPDVVVIDVRTPEEIADGKIEGALEINVNDPSFDQKVQELDKSTIYLVYCAAGVRSAKSCEKMADMGFERLYNLKGGYGAWIEAQ